MTSRSLLRALVPCSIAALLSTSAFASLVDPTSFTESAWITLPGFAEVTGMAWAPDGSGRLFLTLKGGTIRIVKPGPPPFLEPTPFATVSPIYTVSECGLIGIAFDPDFLSNGYVYVFVTVSSTQQQIIRYTAVGDTGSNKTVVMPGLPTNGANHDGGAVGFGPDGRLYWAIGDQGNGTGVDADLTSLASKVGRANVEGTVPADNPFVDGAGPNNDYIWARGFRNPFTFTFQPSTGTLWVDVAGSNYEQAFVVNKGEHAGWNDFENNQPPPFIRPIIRYRTAGTDTRNITATGAVRAGNVATFTTSAAHFFLQGEKLTIAGVTDATFNGGYYVASIPTATTFTVAQAGPDASSGGGTATTLFQGNALTGGAFYDGTGFPASHRGNFFYGDLGGRLMRATVGPGTTVTSADIWSTGLGSPIDVEGGPDGALYHVSHGGTVYRTTYNATAQGIIVSKTHVGVVEGHSSALSVRLAVAPVADVNVTVQYTSGSTDVSVSAGSALTFTPANWSVPQTVTLSATDDADILADAAVVTVSSVGMPSETVDVNVLDTSGPFGGALPGRVPDGGAVPGVPLTVSRNLITPGNLDLAWSASCQAAATDYSVQEGVLGLWYSHGAVTCTTGGATSTTITSGGGNRYYLVVPLTADREGSYGTDSTGAERPRPGLRCRLERDTTSCP